MAEKKVCAHCGKQVEFLCAACWRCKDCPVDCKIHMKRVIDGVIGKCDSACQKKVFGK